MSWVKRDDRYLKMCALGWSASALLRRSSIDRSFPRHNSAVARFPSRVPSDQTGRPICTPQTYIYCVSSMQGASLQTSHRKPLRKTNSPGGPGLRFHGRSGASTRRLPHPRPARRGLLRRPQREPQRPQQEPQRPQQEPRRAPLPETPREQEPIRRRHTPA